MNKVRIVILGAGKVSQHYKKIFQNISNSIYEIVGVCDTNLDAARSLSKNFNCLYEINFKLLLRKLKPDLVFILTPSGLHFEHAKIALEEGCHVLVEKPIANIPDEASFLKKIANENNKMLIVAFQNRLNPAIQCLKNALDNNRFGKIVTSTVRLRWCRYQNYYDDQWHGTWSLDGGVINQQAIHHIDVLNWLIGPVSEVCSVSANQLNKLEAEDTMVGIIKFSNGGLGTIEATTAARPIDYEASLSVVGEKGYAVIGGIALNKIDKWNFVEKIEEDKIIPEKYSLEVPSGYGLSHEILINKTLQSIINEDYISPIEIDSCISTCELIHGLYSSHENQKWAKLNERPLSRFLGR